MRIQMLKLKYKIKDNNMFLIIQIFIITIQENKLIIKVGKTKNS